MLWWRAGAFKSRMVCCLDSFQLPSYSWRHYGNSAALQLWHALLCSRQRPSEYSQRCKDVSRPLCSCALGSPGPDHTSDLHASNLDLHQPVPASSHGGELLLPRSSHVPGASPPRRRPSEKRLRHVVKSCQASNSPHNNKDNGHHNWQAASSSSKLGNSAPFFTGCLVARPSKRSCIYLVHCPQDLSHIPSPSPHLHQNNLFLCMVLSNTPSSEPTITLSTVHRLC